MDAAAEGTAVCTFLPMTRQLLTTIIRVGPIDGRPRRGHWGTSRMPPHIREELSPVITDLRRYTSADLADPDRRSRLAYLSACEETSWRERGRGLTEEEVREALRVYPGDLPVER